MGRRSLAFVMAFMLLLLCVPAVSSAKTAGHMTVLLLGTNQTGSKVQSADAIVIADFNLETGAVKLAMIRKDLLVKGPDGAETVLGSAIAQGGPETVQKVVNDFYRLDIKDYILADLGGMEKIVDGLGGVELEIGASEAGALMEDGMTRIVQASGLQTLDGKQALAFMKDHAGEAENGPHLGRVLASLMHKGAGMGLNPLLDIISEMILYVSTNMTLMDMMDIAFSVLSVPVSEMGMKQFPLFVQEEANGEETAVRVLDEAAEIEELSMYLYGNP